MAFHRNANPGRGPDAAPQRAQHRGLVEALEVRFLANRDAHLHFGLLTDFQDALQETLPGDDALVRLVQTGIEELNRKYQGENGRPFLSLSSAAPLECRDERMWMGYERKRGKLADLNALAPWRLDRIAFHASIGETDGLSTVKYVITLDTDTQLPRDAARQFVAAMAHPLNRPRYDEAKQPVVEGYGILQPRVAVSLPGTNRSRYARLHGSEPGHRPLYARRLGCLSGPVRRRLLHRQGHL